MAGGKKQGDRTPQTQLTADEIIENAKQQVESFTAKESSGKSKSSIDREISNFGAPSINNERPRNALGERDLSAIAPGRKSPFA